MSYLLVGVLIGIFVSFIGWGAKRLFFRHQLHLIQPKLLDYSGLGPNANSKTIEVTVINSGRLAEEAIKVQFAPGFRYNIVASSAPDLVIGRDGILSIDRLTPKQEITVIIYVEGGEFRKEHIQGITSKEVVGTIKDSLQAARTTPLQILIIIPLLFIGMMTAGYIVGKFIEIAAWPSIEASLYTHKTLKYSAENKVTTTSYQLSDTAKQILASTIKIASISRAGDSVYIDVSLTNDTKDKLTYLLSISSSISDQRPDGYTGYIKTDITLYSGMSKTIELSDYLPKHTVPQLISFDAQVTRSVDSASVDVNEDLKLN